MSKRTMHNCSLFTIHCSLLSVSCLRVKIQPNNIALFYHISLPCGFPQSVSDDGVSSIIPKVAIRSFVVRCFLLSRRWMMIQLSFARISTSSFSEIRTFFNFIDFYIQYKINKNPHISKYDRWKSFFQFCQIVIFGMMTYTAMNKYAIIRYWMQVTNV